MSPEAHEISQGLCNHQDFRWLPMMSTDLGWRVSIVEDNRLQVKATEEFANPDAPIVEKGPGEIGVLDLDDFSSQNGIWRLAQERWSHWILQGGFDQDGLYYFQACNGNGTQEFREEHRGIALAKVFLAGKRVRLDGLTKIQRDVMCVFYDTPGDTQLSAQEVFEHVPVGKTKQAVRCTIDRLVKKGLLHKPAYARYALTET